MVSTNTIALALLAIVSTSGAVAIPVGDAQSLPSVVPAPQSITRVGNDIGLPAAVELVVDETTDAAARSAVTAVLHQAGVKKIKEVHTPNGDGVAILLGAAKRQDVAEGLGDLTVPEGAEAYGISVSDGRIVIGGSDGPGQFYGVQTLRQLIVLHEGRPRVAGVSVTDAPVAPLRGVIEGFYGTPWTQADRLNLVEFYGRFKGNTYVYAPKDDPYHRGQWRDPYPADKLAELKDLVATATANHVRFTFALSPGNTVCYSSDDDVAAVIAKFQQMYDIGVRAFNVPFDDIDLSSWHCEADGTAFGSPGRGSAGKAQAHFLTQLQNEFIEQHNGTYGLQMVPTEYNDLNASPYKTALQSMDSDIVIMWTGNKSVPSSISVGEAQQAAKLFGRPTFLWDNYPVNDYPNTAGRLLLAPYDKRERGLAGALSGIVSNPMNQASASKLVIAGVLSFSWNDQAYDVEGSWRAAMQDLTGGNSDATAALEVFADLNHLAPTYSTPWQPQAPALQAQIDQFWATWDGGDEVKAISVLQAYASKIVSAPAAIQAGVTDSIFLSNVDNWLNATVLWGHALETRLDALQAALKGNDSEAETADALSRSYVTRASEVVASPLINRWSNPHIRLGDGVLDVFIAKAADTKPVQS